MASRICVSILQGACDHVAYQAPVSESCAAVHHTVCESVDLSLFDSDGNFITAAERRAACLSGDWYGCV